MNGCISQDNITVTVGLAPAITESNGSLSTGSYTSYQWYLDGAIINGATNQSYDPTENGDYTVEVSSGNCRELSVNFFYTMSSIGDDLSTSFKVYPNPSNGVVFIESNADNQIQSIRIKNHLGQTIQTLNKPIKKAQIRLMAGVYFIEMSNSNGVEIKKLVVTK